MQLRWFALLVASICLEGLGRKYLPGVPSAAFYFLKDIVLVIGLIQLRPPKEIGRTAKWLYRGFSAFWLAAFGWTVVEMFNPESPSRLLGLLGLRAYWLWWIAPILVACVLRNPKVRHRAIHVLLFTSIGISVLGALQFASPPDSAINLYSTFDGTEVYATAVVSTGRARVSGTFTYMSGFTAFTILVPTLLLSLGLEARDRTTRRWALIGTLVCASVLPMSGSRSSLLIGGVVIGITAWSAGLFFTRIGRRVLMGSVVAAVLAVVAFPDAFTGVMTRFADKEETSGRFESLATALPPVAMTSFEYPFMGLGTGMQHNARVSMNVPPAKYEAEITAGRYLIELGPIGYVLVWLSQVGLAVALWRAYLILKRGGRRAAAGAALSYAAVTPFSNLVFDHIFQALYFIGCGFFLSEVLDVLTASRAAAAAARDAKPVAERR